MDGGSKNGWPTSGRTAAPSKFRKNGRTGARNGGPRKIQEFRATETTFVTHVSCTVELIRSPVGNTCCAKPLRRGRDVHADIKKGEISKLLDCLTCIISP